MKKTLSYFENQKKDSIFLFDYQVYCTFFKDFTNRKEKTNRVVVLAINLFLERKEAKGIVDLENCQHFKHKGGAEKNYIF